MNERMEYSLHNAMRDEDGRREREREKQRVRERERIIEL